MSRRYDKVTIRVDYTESFAPVAAGKWAGGLNLSWQFLPIAPREERLAILWKWWHEDHPPGYAQLDIT